MPDYRLYKLHPYSGHITDVEELHADDDVSAVHAVRHRRFDVAVELWNGGRKVTHLDALPGGAAFFPLGMKTAQG